MDSQLQYLPERKNSIGQTLDRPINQLLLDKEKKRLPDFNAPYDSL